MQLILEARLRSLRLFVACISHRSLESGRGFRVCRVHSLACRASTTVASLQLIGRLPACAVVPHLPSCEIG